jgi:hypothetical protein
MPAPTLHRRPRQIPRLPGIVSSGCGGGNWLSPSSRSARECATRFGAGFRNCAESCVGYRRKPGCQSAQQSRRAIRRRNKSRHCDSGRRRDSGLGTRDSGPGTRGSGLGTRDSGFGTRHSGPGTRGSGFGIRDSGQRLALPPPGGVTGRQPEALPPFLQI